MAEERDIGVDQEGEEQVLYYFLAPNGKIYENPDNYPVDSIAKAFKQPGSYIRFAYNKLLNMLFFQDEDQTKSRVEERDPAILDAINTVVTWVQKTHKSSYPKLGNGTGFGEPPAVCQARKLSDYQVAWQYISRFLKSEFQGTSLEEHSTPLDINIAEYYEEKSENEYGYIQSFHPDGLSIMDKTFHGPTLVLNRAPEIPAYYMGRPPKEQRRVVDYGLISMYIAVWYLKHFEEIAGTQLSQAEKYKMYKELREFKINDLGYDVFYAAYNPADKSCRVYLHSRNALETISVDEARKILSGEMAKYMQDKGIPVPQGPLYTGPMIVFSYLPYRKQIIWQSVDPRISQSDKVINKMCDDSRKQVMSWYGTKPEEMTESWDPSKHIPNIAKMSHYAVAWHYICNVMAPRYGFNPDEYDIEVLECPRPVGDAIAVFISTKEEQSENENVMEAVIGFGLRIKYPFIAINSLNDDKGLSLNALIHEYEHYVNTMFQKKKERVPFKDFNDPRVSEEERTKRFLSYITSQKEHDAHLEQMVYMLHMGMNDRDILNTFCPISMMEWRAEYRMILNEAKKIYLGDRAKKKIPQQYTRPKPAVSQPQEEIPKKPQEVQQEPKDVEAASSTTIKTSDLDIGVNDWFWEGLQDLMNQKRHVNQPNPQNESVGFNLSRMRHQPHLEQALDGDRDKDESFLKSLEQLLRENQI